MIAFLTLFYNPKNVNFLEYLLLTKPSPLFPPRAPQPLRGSNAHEYFAQSGSFSVNGILAQSGKLTVRVY